jgi:hypothetical protein
MVWDVATAVAWRMDPDRYLLPDIGKDPDTTAVIESVFVERAEKVETPPRLRKSLDLLREKFPDAIRGMMLHIVQEHIFAALSSDVAESVQHPDRTPFLIIGEDAPSDAVLVDIDKMLVEYQNAPNKVANWNRNREQAIKKVIRNSVTPRFDNLDVKLEEVSEKLDKEFNNVNKRLDGSASAEQLDRRFDEVLEQIRKLKPRNL